MNANIKTTTAYLKALRADNAWGAELIRAFGKDANRVQRYTVEGRGDTGSKLRKLHDAKTAASLEYSNLMSATQTVEA